MRHVSYLGFLQDVTIICMRFNGSVTSWIRSPKHNEAVDGASNSFHLTGYAVDVAFDTDEDREDAIAFAKELGYDIGLYDSHVHIEADPHLP